MKKRKKEDLAGGFFVGPIVLGIGIGLLYGRPDIGVLVGLGVGFILYATIKIIKKS